MGYSNSCPAASCFVLIVVSFLVLILSCILLTRLSAPHHVQEHTQFTSFARFLSSRPAAMAPAAESSPSPAVALICNGTVYPQACVDSFISQSSGSPMHSDLKRSSPRQLVVIALKAAQAVVQESHAFAKNCSKFASSNGGLHPLEQQAVEDCMEMMDRAKDQLSLAIVSLSSMADIKAPTASAKRDALLNLNVWLSASLSFQMTCSDGFQLVASHGYGKCDQAMQKRQERVAEVLANSLDLLKKLFKHGAKLPQWKTTKGSSHRRLLSAHTSLYRKLKEGTVELGLPSWVSTERRQLLQADNGDDHQHDGLNIAPSPSAYVNIYYDMVVAQDGSGDFLNITEALRNIPPSHSGRPFVVYVKKGVYDEIVDVPASLANLTMIGDGMGYTVITGNNSVGSGLFNTLRTATFGISGDGFMARDITFRNTAGPEGYQAVALRASADKLIFYRCSFEGFQDTLYALSSRQFYRDCTISGTVDFIFGNAIASFQECRLMARRPLKGQQNTLTAQGRKVEVDISGFSFQNCTLMAAPELLSTAFPVSSYLGRPWKPFSRTVFLQSFLDSLINPAGWLPWNASNPFTDTIYYGEFQNRGPGSATDGRVAWKGVHPAMNVSDAALFTADNFILGSAWLPLSQVDYTFGLITNAVP